MEKERKQRRLGYFLHRINARHKVSFRTDDSDEERGFLYVSTLRIIFAVVGVVLVIGTGVVLLIIYTPLLDKLPIHAGEQARKRLIESVYKIDSLEEQLSLLAVYTDNVSLIMEGKTPSVRYIKGADSVAIYNKDIVPHSKADSLFRSQMAHTLVADANRVVVNANRMNFVSPIVAGSITNTFDIRNGHYGISVHFTEPQQIVAVQDGTVIVAGWTPEKEYSIIIQHRENFISKYEHVSEILVKTSDRVGSGSAIAYTQPASNSSGDFCFELWYDGSPIDPERYVPSLSNIR